MTELIMSGLFPVGVGQKELDNPLSSEEINFLYSYKNKTRRNHGNNFTFDTYILDNPILKNLKENLEKVTKEYIVAIYQNDDINIHITQSWLNFNNPGDYHHMHHHTNSIISGVYYVETNDDDKLNFFRENLPLFELSKNGNFNAYTASSWWLPVKKNSVILFPSNTRHSVDTNNSNKVRISLAFNTFLSGKIGEEYQINELIIGDKK